MGPDLWQQWQAYAAQFAPLSPSPPGRSSPFHPAHVIDSAERFAAAARNFLSGVTGAPSAAAVDAARKFSDFLREQFAAVPPWSAASGMGTLGGAPTASPLDAPALGLTREHLKRSQRLADAWQRAVDAQHRLQRLWADALRDAATQFAARQGLEQAAPISAEALRKLYEAWIDCAEEAYARAAHSDAFCDALADFVNASSQCRRELQAGIEHWAKLVDLPTRSEVNTLAERLKAVERQLRAGSKERKPKVAAQSPRPARRKTKR